MKTIITKEIDGKTVILGFDRPLIDPVATKNTVTPILAETDQAKAVVSKSEEMAKLWKARSDSFKAAKEAFRQKNTSQHAKMMYEVELRDEQLTQLGEDMIGLKRSLEEKRLELWNANLVYFEPKAGEIALEDESLPEKFMSLGKKEVLLLDGTVVKDDRGVKYVKDGKVLTVEALGEKPDGPLMEDVSPEEFEFMRLDAMTVDELQAEFDSADDGLASQAANMKVKLEIKGDADADSKAKAFYQDGLRELKIKYGIGQ